MNKNKSSGFVWNSTELKKQEEWLKKIDSGKTTTVTFSNIEEFINACKILH